MTVSLANIKRMFTRRSILVVCLLMLASVSVSACAIQETNTYPVETFSEMHYAQSHKAQEPPRLAPPADSVAFQTAGDADDVLNVPDKQERDYDPAVAGNLYQVNCAVCHGVSGLGDGKAVRHITSNDSYWTTTNGSPYKAPPNLVESATNRLTEPEMMYSFVSGWNGPVMPTFGKLLSEEDIRDIVTYIFDDTNGLSK